MSTDSLSHSRSISWFTLVGALAATVHYIIAVGLETGLSVAPAWANLSGFLLAFPVSYVGHSQFSFAHQKSSHQQALPRFLLIACGGFCANQLLLLSLLKLFALPFWLILAIVMAVVAGSSYLLSRYWAFKSA